MSIWDNIQRGASAALDEGADQLQLYGENQRKQKLAEWKVEQRKAAAELAQKNTQLNIDYRDNKKAERGVSDRAMFGGNDTRAGQIAAQEKPVNDKFGSTYDAYTKQFERWDEQTRTMVKGTPDMTREQWASSKNEFKATLDSNVTRMKSQGYKMTPSAIYALHTNSDRLPNVPKEDLHKMVDKFTPIADGLKAEGKKFEAIINDKSASPARKERAYNNLQGIYSRLTKVNEKFRTSTGVQLKSGLKKKYN
jgi:hypothetical protein